MFVYNLTVKVDKEILQQWIKWQQEEHIPEIMATNLFTEIKIFELLEPDELDEPTFILQYFTDSKENYNRYINEYSHALEEKAWEKWGDSFIAFRTLMQTVH